MYEVEVSSVVLPSAQELLEQLSPRAILESAEIYEIHEASADGTEFTVSVEEDEMTVAFTELEDGYEYAFVDGGGTFEERYSRLTVESGAETRVTAVTRYSFQSRWSFVLNRLGAGTVTTELETIIANLVQRTYADESDAESHDA